MRNASGGRLPGTLFRRRHELRSHWIVYRLGHDLIHGSQGGAVEFPAHYLAKRVKLTGVVGFSKCDRHTGLIEDPP